MRGDAIRFSGEHPQQARELRLGQRSLDHGEELALLASHVLAKLLTEGMESADRGRAGRELVGSPATL